MKSINTILSSFFALTILCPLAAQADAPQLDTQSVTPQRATPQLDTPVSVTPQLNNLQLLRSKASGRIVFAKGDGVTKATDALTQANNFVNTAAASLGVGATTLSAQRLADDRLGMKHVTFAQKYRRIPVFGGEVIVHVNRDTTLSSAGATLSANLQTRSVASISGPKAASYAIEAWQKQFRLKTRPTVQSANQYILDLGLIKNRSATQAYMVWEISLFETQTSLRNYKYYVDANTGAIRFALAQSHAQSAAPSPIYRKVYDCSAPTPPGNPSNCPIVTVNNYTYGRTEPDPARGPNPNFLPAAVSMDTDNLFGTLGYVHQFYWDTFGRNGASNQGGTGSPGASYLPQRTYGGSYLNYATGWADSCPNAVEQNGVVYFCKDFVTDDIVAHEYAHAVVLWSHLDTFQNPVGMTYSDEAGALNESHSDVMGQIFEQYRNGSTDWVSAGGTIFGSAYERNLANPPSRSSPSGLGAEPDRYNSSLFYCGLSDYGGVHQNSTVPSKAAYLMARGGFFNGCTVTGIGDAKMSKILYRAVTTYYAQTETFNGAFYSQLQACSDLVGQSAITSDDCLQVQRALQAVEMDQAGRCSGLTGTAPGCADAVGF